MENSRYKKLKVYITGYGPFKDITNNPSHRLVDFIMEKKSEYEKDLKNLCEIVHKEVYEVSINYVSENVGKCHSLIEESLQCGGKEYIYLYILV